MSTWTPPPTGHTAIPGRGGAELICAAKSGSREAKGQLFEASYGFLLMVAKRALDSDLRSKVGASDLVQEAFADAHQDFSNFRGVTEAELFGWLLAILEHRLSKTVRHYRGTLKRNVANELPAGLFNRASEHLPDERPTPSTTAQRCEEEFRVRQALAQLPPKLREVLVERTWQRVPFADIGKRLGCSTEAARKLWSRAVQQLGHLLREPP